MVREVWDDSRFPGARKAEEEASAAHMERTFQKTTIQGNELGKKKNTTFRTLFVWGSV